MLNRFKIVHTLAALILIVIAACESTPSALDSAGESRRVSADGVELQVTTSERNVRTSEMFDLTLNVRHLPTYQLQLPEESERLGAFYVFETHDSQTRLDADGWVEMTRVYTLEPDLPGEAEIPEMLVTIKDAQGKSSSISSPVVPVLVKSVLSSEKETFRKIAPDEPSEKLAMVSPWPRRIVIAGVVMVCLLLLIWRSWKKNVGPLSDDAAHREFVKLQSGLSAKNLQELEVCAVRVIASTYGVELGSCDFAGLLTRLQSQDIDCSELSSAVNQYNQLMYSRSAQTELVMAAVYSEFKKIIDAMRAERKEAQS